MKTRHATLALAAITALALTACGRAGAENKKEKSHHKSVQELTTEEFKAKVYDFTADKMVYLSDKPAIVDFAASWCEPCRQIAPILEELAEEYGDRIMVYKVDISKEKKVARAFNISSIPAILYIPVGKDPVLTIGARSKSKFKTEIETFLLGK